MYLTVAHLTVKQIDVQQFYAFVQILKSYFQYFLGVKVSKHG